MLCKKITSPRLLELLPHHSTILSHQPTALSWGTLQKSNKRSISFHHYHDRIRVTRPWIPFWHLQIIISARTRSRLPSFSITTPQKTVSRPGSATLRRYLRSGGQIRLGETSTTASPITRIGNSTSSVQHHLCIFCRNKRRINGSKLSQA